MQTTVFDQVNETVYHETLQNGLQVYLVPKQGFSKTYAVFTTRYGSIDSHFRTRSGEEINVPDGIAHFLEHKMFEKKDRDVMHEFSKNGASCNAFTSFNRTAYLFSCTDKLDDNLNLLLDYVQDPYFTDASVEKEKGIIGQEITMYDDNPDWKVYMNLLKAMYQKYPINIEIAGTIETISHITKEYLYQCYETFYHPANMLLLVVGSFEPEAIMKLIRENQGAKEFPPAPQITRVFPDEPSAPAEAKVEAFLTVGLPKCMIGIKEKENGLTKEALLKRELTTKLVLDIAFGTSSAVYERLYDSELITESFDFDYSSEQDYAYTIIGGDTPDPERLVETIKAEIEQLKQAGIAQDDFERAKRKKIGNFLRSLNSVEFIANQFTSFKFNGNDLFSVVPTLESITREDVEKRLKEHFLIEQMAVSIVRSASPQE
ncbi:insulinase family protein [Brevibacillus sp. M2.1A]|uniref:EF-P 5-aminopentanol modification-associated protein YfmH n=1 Tax=Brevibacillus TaxID=55080 RepID=UPI00156AC116|nr:MULTISPECIES: pitrilysin family protein [Brevibacillus]MBY0088714.1 insulinase family protein [Brevibacillus brevis]MCC8436838.1 insulinase family protein [Brevibacillus sp. M2.1A]MCE0448829.1 insulinase family protein [Brevibacillus sp. AF8]UKK99012.1 insulinase family protein [Brevibacillus brevis]